jgi:hypothetical protein
MADDVRKLFEFVASRGGEGDLRRRDGFGGLSGEYLGFFLYVLASFLKV